MDSAFRAVYQSALEDPETFWAQAAEDVHWYRRWIRSSMIRRRRFIAGFPAHKLTHVLTPSICMLSKVVASRLR